MREAMASTRLSGVDASLVRLLRSRFEEDDGEDRAIDAVEACRSAARHARERLGELPLGSRLIRSVHARLFEAEEDPPAHPGQFRQVAPLRSRSPASGAESATAAPAIPPVPRMREGMQALDDFLEADQEMPPVLVCAFVHGHVRRMHPFRRGNGRVARMLIPLVLADADILTRPVLCPSVAVEQNRATYLERLSTLEDTEGREAWLAFFLRLLAEAAGKAEDAVRRLRRMRSEHHARVREGSRSSHAPDLLDHLLAVPVTTAHAAAHALDVHYVTANNLIGELEEMELLREVTGRRRDRIFVYEPYLTFLETG